MRVLYFSQYFPPEVGATQTRAYEMCRYLASQGHKVTAITEVPNHPSGIIPGEYKGRLSERRIEDGIDVLRLWVWTSPEKTFRSRMQFYLSYMGMSALAGVLLRGKYDVVYATSPPLFVATAGLITALTRRVPFIFEVRDLWPESAVALGELNSKKAIAAAEKLEVAMYRRARRIVVVTEGIRARLVERGISGSKITVIPNGANTEKFRYTSEGARQVEEMLGLAGMFVVMYAGVHGIAQGLETLLQAADLLRHRDDIILLFIGEGPRKAHLRQIADQQGLANVRFLPEVQSSMMPAYLSAAGCAIVPLRDEPLFRGAMPSKMFEAWACARPVILSVAGEAEQVMKQADGGLAIQPEDAASMAQAIERLAANPEQAQQMGEHGRNFVQKHYSRQVQAQKLEALLKQVANKR
ncbi:MAG TPA: glycosyltransferase family 4 protein [Chloroflexia bacterium]|nr:glycosyltransferase family 4 protein [Chloroflexia bacterium]